MVFELFLPGKNLWDAGRGALCKSRNGKGEDWPPFIFLHGHIGSTMMSEPWEAATKVFWYMRLNRHGALLYYWTKAPRLSA